jgi:hypothetical protein
MLIGPKKLHRPRHLNLLSAEAKGVQRRLAQQSGVFLGDKARHVEVPAYAGDGTDVVVMSVREKYAAIHQITPPDFVCDTLTSPAGVNDEGLARKVIDHNVAALAPGPACDHGHDRPIPDVKLADCGTALVAFSHTGRVAHVTSPSWRTCPVTAELAREQKKSTA